MTLKRLHRGMIIKQVYILQLVAIVTFFMFFSVCSFIISCWTIWIEWAKEKIVEQNGAMAQNIWPKRQGTTSANMRQLRINIERWYKQRFECSFICLGAKCGIESLVTGHQNLCNGILKHSQANNYLILPDNEPRFCDVDGYFHTCDDFTKLLLP